MQLAAPEALDISKESDAMKAMYGIQEHRKVWPTEINAEEEADYMGRKCLAARRLLERGVRFVQIWSGNDNGFRAATGTAMKTSSAITARSPGAWRRPFQR
jgi:hypothetical protein